jgi:APA family basic amino acid/polyamine antiporter
VNVRSSLDVTNMPPLTHMRRTLGRFDITCLGLNAIVGSGIFLLPDDLYRELGVLSPLAFVCCAIGLLPIALCYARAASMCEKSGGPYVYASEAFGSRVGFAVGWMCFTNSVFSFAAVAAAAAAYAARLVPSLGDPVTQKLVSVLVISVFAALNYRGAKPGALAVDAFTAGKFLVLVILVSVLLGRLDVAHFAGGELPHDLGKLGTATFIALFAAQGFEVVPVPAGETRRPERDVPFAVLSSLAVASLLYVLVQFALVGSGADLSAPSDAPLADAAIAIAPVLGLVIAIGGLISTLGFVSGSALGTPRYQFAVALDGQLPRGLAGVHPRFQSPHVAVIATATLAIACVVPFDYRALIGMSNVAVAVQYLATSLAVQKLGKDRSQRTSPWISWMGVAVSLWIFTEASAQELIWAAVALVVGAALVLLTTRAAAKKPA